MSRSPKKSADPTRRDYGGDFQIQLRETLNDGIFYDTCQDAMENWDESWVVCPVCLGTVENKENVDIVIKTVEHKEIIKTQH